MKRNIILWGLAICFAVSLNVAGKTSDTTSFIMCNEKKLVIIDAAATWNATKKEMRIYFFPFKLTADDLKKIKSGRAWSIGFRKKSPDKKLWASWCPNGEVKIDFSQSNPSLKSATFCNFIFFGLAKKNYTANLNKNGKDVQKNIQKLTLKGNSLIFKSKSSGKLFKEKYTWNLSVSCPVFNVKK